MCAASPVLSVIAWIFLVILEAGNILVIVPAAVGIIPGFIGNNQVKQIYGDKKGRAWAVIGIILGFISLILWMYEILALLF